MKISLALKIVVMIAVPLFAGLGYIAFLNNSLQSLEDCQRDQVKTDRLLLLNDLMMVGSTRCMLLFGMLRATQNPIYKDKIIENERFLDSTLRRLAELCKDNPARMSLLLKVSRQRQQAEKTQWLLAGPTENATMADLLGGPLGLRMARTMLTSHMKLPLVREFEREKAQVVETEKRERAEAKQVSRDLYCGLGAAVILYVVLIWWLRHSVATRLKVVQDNIKSTASGEHSFKELGHTDEIDSLNARIIASARQIREAESEQAQTVRLIAEELELPLKTIAKAYTDLKCSGFVELSENGAQRISKAIEETARLETLVEELSRTTEVNAAAFELDIKHFDLSELGRSSVSVVEEFARKRKIEIVCKLKPVMVYGDFDRVKQVAINLLSNAIKFSPEGGQICVSVRPDASGGLLSVRDDGPGIPEEFKNRVFKRFEQSGAKTESNISGSGLGLAISKELMLAQHGQLQFESPLTAGRGTEFWLWLPVDHLATDADGALRTAAGASAGASAQFSAGPAYKRKPLWVKGAFAFTIPLFLYLVMSGMLFFTLHAMRDNMNDLARTWKIGSLCSQLIDAYAKEWNFALLYNASQDEECLKGAGDAEKTAKAVVHELEPIASKDPDLTKTLNEVKSFASTDTKFVHELLAAKEELLADQFFGSTSVKTMEARLSQVQDSLLQAIEYESDRVQAHSARLQEIHRWTEIILLTSAIVISSVSLLFITLLAVRWTKRIKPILENVANLARGEAPANLLYGDDELAKIDGALHDAAAKLDELKRFKNELMSVTSHELRTPLTSLAALTEMIEAGMYGSLTESGREALSQAEYQISDLIFTITNLLDLEKMVSGKTLVHKGSTLVSDVLDKVKANSERAASEREIELKCGAASGKVPADLRRLVQSLTALVRHYIDLVPEQSTLRLSFARSAAHADFVVATPRVGSDTVFDLFRSDHSARQHLVEELARMIADQHGGAMSIYDEGGERHYQLRLPVSD